MIILIDIPDADIPKKQDILSINLCFVDGQIGQCTYPFMVLQDKTIDLNDQMVKAEIKPKIGHWITCRSTYFDVNMYRCSECKKCIAYKLEKCPNCGIKMDEGWR